MPNYLQTAKAPLLFMKSIRFATCLLLLLLAGAGTPFSLLAQETGPKATLKILYVGYSPSKPMPEKIVYYMTTDDRYKEIIQTRMPAFVKLLEKYFTKVAAIDVREYTPAMSENADVTILDAGPVQLPEGFNRPTILMHAMAPNAGLPLGLKFDWYCQCLDNDALNLRTKHEIFNTPYKVPLTLKDGPTPSSFFNGYQGKHTPATMPMWRVVTEGMTSEKKYLIGMVSHGEGFDDSPDAEAIAGGVCWKNAEAVSIGRHGNFFMWGFAGSPDYMTDEANLVFVNAIHYIHKFDRMYPIVKKVQTETRTGIDELIYRLDKDLYLKALTARKEGNDRLRQAQQVYKDKKAAGEDIGPRNEAFLKMPLQDEGQTFEAYIKGFVSEELFQKYGTDIAAYHKYYRATYEYYYPAGSQGLQLDADARKLGISNRSKALLEKCISLLELRKDTALARRLLERYTFEKFATPKAWRNWYTANKAKLFYTESGGFKFVVNTYGKPASQAGTTVKTRGKPIRKETSIPVVIPAVMPTSDDPVVIAAQLFLGADANSAELVMSASILKGWHIYAYVTPDAPFIQTETSLELPKGVTADKDWATSAGVADPSHAGVVFFEDQATFRIKINKAQLKEGDEIKCGLYYQACDLTKCFPPLKKELTVIYKSL